MPWWRLALAGPTSRMSTSTVPGTVGLHLTLSEALLECCSSVAVVLVQVPGTTWLLSK